MGYGERTPEAEQARSLGGGSRQEAEALRSGRLRRERLPLDQSLREPGNSHLISAGEGRRGHATLELVFSIFIILHSDVAFRATGHPLSPHL